MNTIVPDCPRCRVRMDAGHVLGLVAKEGPAALSWFEGSLEKGFLGRFKIKGKRRFELMAYRCGGCGYLIWFAPDTPDEPS